MAAIALGIELIDLRPAPSRMTLGVGECGIHILCGGDISHIRCIDAIPLTAVEYRVYIIGGNIVADTFAACVPIIDIYSLCILVSFCGKREVIYPACDIIVSELEDAVDVILADDGTKNLRSGHVPELLVHAINIVDERNDTPHPVGKRTAEVCSLHGLVDDIVVACTGKTRSMRNKRMKIFLQLFLGERPLNVIEQLLEDGLPVLPAELREVEDVLELVLDLNKGNVLEVERAVRDHGLELLA